MDSLQASGSGSAKVAKYRGKFTLKSIKISRKSNFKNQRKIKRPQHCLKRNCHNETNEKPEMLTTKRNAKVELIIDSDLRVKSHLVL